MTVQAPNVATVRNARATTQGVTRHDKALRRVLDGGADQTIRFDALCALLRHLGFAERRHGSHRIFSKEGMPEIVNLQSRPDGTAKPYQVRQVRTILLDRGFGEAVNEEDDER